MDYLYNVKDKDSIEIADIIFTDLDENNRPICEFIVLSQVNETNKFIVFCLEDKEIQNLDLTNYPMVYYLGNICQKLSVKELMKTVQKRYVWLGIEYELIKILVNLLDGTVEKYNYENEEWEYLEEGIEDSRDNMVLNIGNIRFRINLTNLKVQIMNEHTLRFRNYNNYVLGLEGEYVFNSDNELELINPNEIIDKDGGTDGKN